MRWELRARAVERGLLTAAGLRRRLAGAGLAVSAGKMSHLWSGTPVSVRLDDLEVICAVLGCEPSDLLVRDRTGPLLAPRAAGEPSAAHSAAAGSGPRPVPEPVSPGTPTAAASAAVDTGARQPQQTRQPGRVGRWPHRPLPPL
ncbi:helix-turn-helix domain-containing protein [Streptomyces sp. NPDC001980]|uniref:helix-turn-helix domain-containing protein n=1 Tax=Streptomyces sp. NPDC001980 TaxID=3157126 RepID=UPI00332496F9